MENTKQDMASPPTLLLAESFVSAQMEGRNTGMPAVFIRLAKCNLSCGFSKDAIHKLKEKVDKTEGYITGGHNHEDADLFNQKKATWVCDSASVWLKGKDTPVESLIDGWKKDGVWEWIGMGRVSLIWTGGEPTLPMHQKSTLKAIAYIKQRYQEDFGAPCHLYNELETNGTVVLSEEYGAQFAQINCSVKLENSGMERDRRIVPAALESIIRWNGDFKFVVSSEDDLKEINRDFIAPFRIHWSKVYMQPSLDKQEDSADKMRFVFDMAKKYGFRAGGRYQVTLYDQATGV